MFTYKSAIGYGGDASDHGEEQNGLHYGRSEGAAKWKTKNVEVDEKRRKEEQEKS